ncbi:hypothetical protein SAMN04488030_0020 [Aliiroseovarius halocynthiae]|uniref:RHS repeat-associated core domain-containing protein n=2 Tax=Aliiroseovarius halocynthiae TaxID=985055 RepID=A0A545SLD2_9RHOB|nr:hypothetical protein [Aliiroseovarius halocynthiae]TQV65778.1 hypothetical protein FIL88_15885 [Aliiroseovarius halocynthiae]SMR83545.1 hypothetical protein SAMN04488030_0020 [Aliiroseovarius halocynthiae]
MLRHLKQLILTALFALFASQASAMFIQPDWYDPANPQVGTNRYAYSHNDPVNKLDPGGNESTDLLRNQEDSDRANAEAAQDALERAEAIRERGSWWDRVRDNLGVDDYWEGRAENHISRIGKSWGERATGDVITGVEVGSVAAGGGVVIQGGRAALKGAAVSAAARREVARQAALEAARRLGIELSEVTITRGVAKATIGVTKTLDPKDIRAVADYMKSQGAARGQLNSGFIANERLETVLERAVGRGPQGFLGGGTVSHNPAKELGNFIIDFTF